jgi:hypothetical protein
MMKLLLASMVLFAGNTYCIASEANAAQDFATVYDFGQIGMDAPMEHIYQFPNKTSEVLEIKNVELTPPLVVTKMSARVEPGGVGSVTVRLGKARLKGEFRGSVTLNFKNPNVEPLLFWAVGDLKPSIEFQPFAAFFVSAQRGEEKVESIEISNHDAEPLKIMNVLSNSTRFDTQLETLEEGKHYRLSLKLRRDAPAGRENETIELVTSSPEHPFLKVQANTSINERVYASPASIDFGAISTIELKAQTATMRNFFLELMTYQVGGTDFQVSAQTDVPFLRLTPHQDELKDRYGIKVELIPEKLKSGAVQGTIVVGTNDPQFPRLEIPVSGSVDGNW